MHAGALMTRDLDGVGRREVPIDRSPPATTSVEHLFLEHAAWVARFLGRIGAPSRDLPDLVQEVFLVAHRRGGFVAGAAKPRTWLAEIAVRVASTARRARRR